MEEIPSSNDSEGDGDSDEFSKEKEEELYAVLHYNDFSQGVPPELLEKYDISTDKNNEFVISFKSSAEVSKPMSDRDDGSKPTNDRREGPVISKASPGSSSDDDVVVVELETRTPVNKGLDSILIENRKRDSADASNLSKRTSTTRNVDVQQKLPAKGSEGVSIKPKMALNPKKRYCEDSVELTPNNKKRNSEDAHVESTPIPKKRKSADLGSVSTTSQFSIERNSKEVESKMAPNPKKRKSREDDSGSQLDIISDDRNYENDIKSKMVANPKNKASSGGTKTTLPLKSAGEVVVEGDSDSSDSSCVVVEDPEINRKISISSTDSVVALMSSGDEVSGFSLNTTGDIDYDSDGNVSDVIETSQFGWEEVASPSTWTQEMRKYYNSPCERLRYFDHKTIRQQIKTGSRKDWLISPRDMYPNNRPRQRCLVCRQTDHLARNCPKKDPTCHMCGVQGHSNMDCPNSICLQCGRKNRQFTSVCRSCTYTLNRECFNCKQAGHESKACPEKWREFHSTTEGPLKKEKPHRDRSRARQCCNCGNANHTFEECNQQSMNNIVKSLPAYNWLLGGSSSREDWRLGFSGFSPPNTFKPPFKRRREHHDRDSFSEGFPRWKPTFKTKSRKKKKRKNFNPFNNSF